MCRGGAIPGNGGGQRRDILTHQRPCRQRGNAGKRFKRYRIRHGHKMNAIMDKTNANRQHRNGSSAACAAARGSAEDSKVTSNGVALKPGTSGIEPHRRHFIFHGCIRGLRLPPSCRREGNRGESTMHIFGGVEWISGTSGIEPRHDGHFPSRRCFILLKVLSCRRETAGFFENLLTIKYNVL